jgi:hypothetical protein
MVSGALTITCLFLAAGTPADDVVHLKQRHFAIPVNLDPATREHIRTVTLYSSTDQGKTWHQEAVIPPTESGFKFYAPTDGLYWFAVDVVDEQGRRDPEDIYQAPPAQKILVDTLKPLVRIVSAERKDDQVEVAWEIQEDHPDLQSLRLEYRPVDAPASAWSGVPLDHTLIGRTRFRPITAAAVAVRLRIEDLAHNEGTVEKEVPAGSGITPVSLSTPASGSSTNVPPKDTAAPDHLPIGNSASGSQAGKSASPTGEAAGKANDDPGFAPVPAAGQLKEGGTSAEASERLAVATTENSGAGSLPPPRAVDPAPGRKALPPLQVVNNPQVTLEYALNRVGPSGVNKVELWLTRDDGQTWRRYAVDAEEVLDKQPLHNGKYQRLLDLPPVDGVYGISLVVRSRAGLGKRPPQAGDVPQMRIEVDTKAPVAQLFKPTPDPNRRDALVISWTASDRNLVANPITLQWAEQPNGPWQNIGANLANTGHHVWQLPAQFPDRVYLRLLVRDSAGNEAVAVTREPQLVDLSEPEGTILGVVKSSGRP